MSTIPFSAQAKTMTIAVTSTAGTSQALPSIGNSVRIISEPGGNMAFVSIGTGVQIATLPGANAALSVATSTPIMPGEDVIFTIPKPEPSAPGTAALSVNGGAFTAPTALNISAICRSALTATLDVQVGEGA